MTEQLEIRLAHLTKTLCDIPSVTGNEKAIADAVEKWAKEGPAHFLPGEIRRIGNSLVLGDLADVRRPMIALVGHLDTVPGTGIPAQLEEKDGLLRVVGLGSSDMKSGDAVMMALAEDLNRRELPVNPVFIFYDREEGPFEENGLEPLLEGTPELKRTAFAVVLESTDGEIQMACQGSIQALVHFDGKKCHSARPWIGENAIYKAIPLLEDLAGLKPVPVTIDGFTYYEVISATLAGGGEARNIIPGKFWMNLNFRFSPSRTVEDAMVALEQFVAGRGRIEWVDRSPAGKVCAQNVHYQRLRDITGAKTTPKQAWTDVARLAQHGIDSVNFGPGITEMAHQVGEWASAQDIARCYRQLRTFLESK